MAIVAGVDFAVDRDKRAAVRVGPDVDGGSGCGRTQGEDHGNGCEETALHSSFCLRWRRPWPELP